ncbi:Bidirectional sugar transporter SWEET14 [Platanthera zijinensis]|uniref:Bidirectional sugar transporter SWEET n=1 Tax=Platanthera zijinensis TaxID=2320716 RepID=A0AAP0G4Y7_9ASPA
MAASPWALTAGILGNIISFLVFLAPISTFYRIYKKKSTEGFQAVPYIVALFSAMLWLYYAFIKTNETILIIINSIGCVVEAIYIAVFLAYAHRKARVHAAKVILFLDVGIFSSIVLSTIIFSKGDTRVTVVGWICVGFAVSVFVAPLSIMKLVIKTKSVEFMPFFLSFFLTLSAVAWFFYGLLIKDIYVMLPNVLGLLFGLAQMLLYAIYRKPRRADESDTDESLKKTKKVASIGDERKAGSGEWTMTVKESNEDDTSIPI